MPNISRRHFLRNASIGAAATGVAAAGGLSLLTGVTGADAATPPTPTAPSGPLLEGSGVVAHVVDAKAGKISHLRRHQAHRLHQPGPGSGAPQSRAVKPVRPPDLVPTHHEVN